MSFSKRFQTQNTPVSIPLASYKLDMNCRLFVSNSVGLDNHVLQRRNELTRQVAELQFATSAILSSRKRARHQQVPFYRDLPERTPATKWIEEQQSNSDRFRHTEYRIGTPTHTPTYRNFQEKIFYNNLPYTVNSVFMVQTSELCPESALKNYVEPLSTQ